MNKLRLWLEKCPNGLSLSYVIPSFWIFKLAYCFITVTIIMRSGIDCRYFSSQTASNDELKKVSSLVLMCAVLMEEMIFRAIPLMFVQGILLLTKTNKKVGIYFLFFTTILSSSLFGYVHGNYLNIAIQGVGGVGYCFLFLKYGGYILHKKENNFNPLVALFVCGFTHFGFNILVTYI